MVMDWRWKAFNRKIDPAQLRTSVTEYLFPRMEVGLAHADITQQMCDSWMSTIMYTISERGGMSSVHNLNRYAFCLLADIPDLWMRTQSSRATEFLVNLNSTNGDHGRTTRARLFDQTGCTNIYQAIESLKSNPPQRRRNYFRFIPSLRYLNSLGIEIGLTPESNDGPLAVTEVLQTVFQKMSDSKCISQTRAFVYTDGSTVKDEPNSGSSIVVMDHEHKEVWSGGLVVRTDGNNFIAELAAAAIVIRACPANFSIILRIDSKAAIGALCEGPVSERKRIRAAGRAWRNYCREDMIAKRNHIKIEHVRSHVAKVTPDQLGNDRADKIAKHFLETSNPLHPAGYFTLCEEQLVLLHEGRYITGDPRKFLKKLEEASMLKLWKSKATRQAEFYLKFPVQFKKMARKVWRWSVEHGDGNAWLYFIFGACQWLPTLHRMKYHVHQDLQICILCRSGSVEDGDHLWVCPALAKEQLQLQTNLDKIIDSLPLALDNIHSREATLRQVWFTTARKCCASEDRCRILARDFWNANKYKPFIAANAFSNALQKVIRRSYPPQLAPNFLKLLIGVFSLNVEGSTNPLQHFAGFEQWYSLEPEDRVFGAAGNFFDSNLAGTNSFIFPSLDSVERSIQKASSIIESPAPSRVLMLIPSNVDHKFLKIADVYDCPVFSDGVSSSELSLVLALNKESLVLDPIDWTAAYSQLKEWSANVQIPGLTDALFKERIPISGPCRASSLNPLTEEMKRDSVRIITFHRPFLHPSNRDQLKSCQLANSEITSLLNLNRHRFSLSTLGVLPNQLRKLLKPLMGECDSILDNLSRVLFWGGYRIWKQRQRLVRQAWERFRIVKHKRKKKKEQSTACKSPFHFLSKFVDLSHQRVTRCPCSLVNVPKRKFDIRSFITISSSPSMQPRKRSRLVRTSQFQPP